MGTDKEKRIEELEARLKELEPKDIFLSKLSGNKSDNNNNPEESDNNPVNNEPETGIKPEPEQPEIIPDELPEKPVIEPDEPDDEDDDEGDIEGDNIVVPEIPQDLINVKKTHKLSDRAILCPVCFLNGSQIIISLSSGVCPKCNTHFNLTKKKKGYIKESAVDEIVKLRLEEEKSKQSKTYFTCGSCNLKVVPYRVEKCPNCKKDHGEWNDFDTQIQIEDELAKVKSKPKTADDVRREILQELEIKRKAEKELEKSKLKVCTFCGEQVLTHRFMQCPECGNRELTPSEIAKLDAARLDTERLEREAEKKRIRCPNCKSVISKKYTHCKECGKRQLSPEEVEELRFQKALEKFGEQVAEVEKSGIKITQLT